MLGEVGQVAKDVTGVTEASGGIDAGAFQNASATAAHLASESGIVQADAIVRSVARGGLRKAFRGLLGLVIAHADQPRSVRLRGEWVEYDPRHWDSGMDCTINIGLGGGTKGRDMGVLRIVLGLQREVLATIGPDNPYVKPDQLYNPLARITETAGFPSAEPFFIEPDMQEVQAKMQAAAQKPDPEQMKLQAQMQLEQMKMQAQAQMKQAEMQAQFQLDQAKMQMDMEAEKARMQVARDKELSQMQADLQVQAADRQVEAERTRARIDVQARGTGREAAP